MRSPCAHSALNLRSPCVAFTCAPCSIPFALSIHKVLTVRLHCVHRSHSVPLRSFHSELQSERIGLKFVSHNKMRKEYVRKWKLEGHVHFTSEIFQLEFNSWSMKLTFLSKSNIIKTTYFWGFFSYEFKDTVPRL